MVHVVSHTHWDREWYLPAARFRQRLVALVDELLDDPPSRDAGFLLDGQAILLDDYLAVRPERRAQLSVLLRERRLEAGPWYVLADEVIPSGEALVRNLLAGRDVLRVHDAESPAALYCPDSFGHPACLPTLARGFGFGVVILWRGYGGRRWPAGDSVRWSSPDGAQVLLYHLAPQGYELGANLPAEEPAARLRWEQVRATLAPRSALGIVLLPNGADHHARQHRLAEGLVALRRVAEPDRVMASSLGAFANAVQARAAGRMLPDVRGELRDSYGYTWTLGGTLATRASQKRRNAVVERLLLHEAEPWAALARRREGRDFRPLVRAAWRDLLRVHPHDTLCGSSLDEVARAADARLDSAEAQAAGIRDDAVATLLGHDAAEARERMPTWRSALVLRNPVARARGGVAHVELLAAIAEVPVGPGSAHSGSRARSRTHGALHVGSESLPVQVLEREARIDRIDSPRHYPRADLVDAMRALVWVPPLGGYATRSYEVRDEGQEGTGRLADSRLFHTVRADGFRLLNDHLSVSSEDGGRLMIESESVRLEDVIGFEHQADRGDLYTPSLRGGPVTTARLRKQRLLHRGPLRATIEQAWTLRVPAAAGLRRPVDIPLMLAIAIDADEPFVRITVRGENTARDHRLRLLVRSGIQGASVLADAAFGPVARAAPPVDAVDATMERPLPTAPLQRWVAAHDGARSLALISDGLAEYEASPDGTIAVTLVRAVGELSRSDLPERPGHAAWPAPTPEAQCPGPFIARFAIHPAGALDDAGRIAIERAAENVLLPITGHTLRSALRLPAPTKGIELSGEGLVFSAAKDARDGEWTVLRCRNVLDRKVRGAWHVGFPLTEARRSRLDETPGDSIPLDGASIRFTAPARGVTTILVR